MDFTSLNKKIEYHHKNKHHLKSEPYFIKNFEESFKIRYTHESTAIEGNSLSLRETKEVIIDKKSVANKDLRELYEVINHDSAFSFVKKNIREGKELSDEIVTNIHERLMDRIMHGGIYRSINVYISGSENELPDYHMVPRLMKEFYQDMEQKNFLCSIKELHPVELACWTHATFINIHPFKDGNGRTARLMMNYQLMKNGYLPISIPKELRLEYCRALDHYQSTGNMIPFVEMVSSLEEKQLDILINHEKSIAQLKGYDYGL